MSGTAHVDNDNISICSKDEKNDGVELEDTSDSKGLFRELLNRMNPASCVGCSIDGGDTVAPCQNVVFDDQDVEDIVAELVKDIDSPGKNRTVALQKLYRLTDKERKLNRVPIVCSERFNIVASLVPALAPDRTSASHATDRRQALLLLNNLCIPEENKRSLVFHNEIFDELLAALLVIVKSRVKESYLAMVCLFNLSFLKEGHRKLFSFVPNQQYSEGQEAYRLYTPTENPSSLLRTVETAMTNCLPLLQRLQTQQGAGNVRSTSFRLSNSVEWEIIRWSMGMFRNLAVNKENAIVVARETSLPALALECLRISDRKLQLWSRDSLEDASLMLLIHIAQHKECTEKLQEILLTCGTEVLEPLRGQGGIHETRAMTLLQILHGSSSTGR